MAKNNQGLGFPISELPRVKEDKELAKIDRLRKASIQHLDYLFIVQENANDAKQAAIMKGDLKAFSNASDLYQIAAEGSTAAKDVYAKLGRIRAFKTKEESE